MRGASVTAAPAAPEGFPRCHRSGISARSRVLFHKVEQESPMQVPATMIAMVLTKPGTPLERCEVPVPAPDEGQFLIAVSACGVCRTDLSIRWLVASVVAIAVWPLPAQAWFGTERSGQLQLPSGTVEVRIEPYRGRALELRPDGPGRWLVADLDEAAIGRAYSIVVDNRTPERLKVVVAVDGLNVYQRVPHRGRSDRDVGSIIDPWVRRTLTGWQVGLDTAERFVLAPPEWSEGAQIAPDEVGTIVVEVYSEQPPWPVLGRDEAAGESAPNAKRQTESACQPGPALGTTAGDAVTSQVRVVSFAARTRFPEARAEIDYGRRERPPVRPLMHGPLGLELISDRGGARVVAVAPGSSADLAGIERGDVVTRIDSERRPDPATVRRVITGKRSGDRVFVWLRRGPHELALKLRVS